MIIFLDANVVIYFVEQPVAEVYENLYASVLRTGLLLLVGMVISALGAWALARGMVRPIRTLEEVSLPTALRLFQTASTPAGVAKLGSHEIDELIRTCQPQDVHVIVVGGETNGYWRIMGCSYQTTVSVDAWR